MNINLFRVFRGSLDDVRGLLETNFSELVEPLKYTHPEVRHFENATSGALLRYLPNGNNVQYDYSYTKTDASVNTVTIYALAPQLIMATTSIVLTTQGDSAHLAFDKASQTWWLI